MHDLEEAIEERQSTRMFLRDKPVPPDLVSEALALAMRAPKNAIIASSRRLSAISAGRHDAVSMPRNLIG